MTTIGTFKPQGEGFTGYIKTLTLDAGVGIEPAAKASDKSPDYRVATGGIEIGAAWKKTSAEGKTYLSLRLDDPSFTAPISCRLVEGDDGHRLIWSR